MCASTLRMKDTLRNTFAVEVAKSIEEGDIYLCETTGSSKSVHTISQGGSTLYKLRAV